MDVNNKIEDTDIPAVSEEKIKVCSIVLMNKNLINVDDTIF